jgi:DNA topoisomerase VI subunit B
MSHTVMFDLEHNRKRLSYYSQQKEKSMGDKKKSAALDKWIEIYAERVQKLERQVTKLGLKTQLAKAPAAHAQSA